MMGAHEVTSDVGFALTHCLLTAPHPWAGRWARATEHRIHDALSLVNKLRFDDGENF